MKIQVSKEQIQKIKNTAKSIQQQTSSRASQAIGKATIDIDREAKKRVPVDTGRLRSSLEFTYKPGDLESTNYTIVEYAQDIEMGSSKKAPEGFLRPAFDKVVPELKKELAKIIGR